MSFEEEIKHCVNMKQVLVIVEKYYILDKPLGIATKIGVQVGIKKILTFIRAEKKNK